MQEAEKNLKSSGFSIKFYGNSQKPGDAPHCVEGAMVSL
jgi:hypothetical protein